MNAFHRQTKLALFAAIYAAMAFVTIGSTFAIVAVVGFSAAVASTSTKHEEEPTPAEPEKPSDPTPKKSDDVRSVSIANLIREFKSAKAGNAKYADKTIRIVGVKVTLASDEGVVFYNLESAQRDGGLITIVARPGKGQEQAVANLKAGQSVNIVGKLIPESSEGATTSIGIVVAIELSDCKFE